MPSRSDLAMGGGRRGRGPKGRGPRRGELAGFLALGLFLALIALLLIPPQAPRPPPAASSATTARMRAAIVDQLGALFPNPAFLSEAKALLRRAGFEVDVYGPGGGHDEPLRLTAGQGL